MFTHTTYTTIQNATGRQIIRSESDGCETIIDYEPESGEVTVSRRR